MEGSPIETIRMDEEEDVLLSVDDYHRHAKSKMTKSAYGYYVGGSEDEHTLRLNQQSFQKVLTCFFLLARKRRGFDCISNNYSPLDLTDAKSHGRC